MSAFEQICLSIPASGAVIAVRDAAGLRCVGSLGDALEVGSRVPSDFGMALECLQNDSVVFSDLPDATQRVLHDGLTMEGVSQVRSAVALPMHADAVIIGVIAVFSHRESSIQARDVKALVRIADFWGPLMADEWFPEGIPTAIAGDIAVADAINTKVTESPHAAEEVESPIVEALPTEKLTPVLEDSREVEEVAAAEKAEAAPRATEPETVVAATIASSAPDPELSPPTEPIRTEETIPAAEPAETPKAPDVDLSIEALTLARAAKASAAPVFFAPAEHIPPEAFSGEPQRLTWIIVLVVFLILLIPIWFLRSHWKHTNAAIRNSAPAANTKPANPNAPNTNAAASSPSPSASTKQAGAANSENSSQTSKALAPDEEMPKPLPDLNTPPPANNPPAASTAPKPSLPEIVHRILKSPTSAAAKPEAPPSAPDITANVQPPASPEPAPAEDSAASNNSESPPEPAEPINPAGVPQSPQFALAQTLKAHSGWVSSLAFSPTGKLASASWDRTVKFWDLSTGHVVRAVDSKLKQVQAVAFTHDGKLLAAEDASDTVTIFDASTGQPIRELPTDKTVPSVGISWVYSIAFSPDSRWLASAVDDKTVRIWDVTTGTKIRDLAGPRRPIVYAAFSPDGELVATGNDEKSIQIWNVASGAPTTTLSGHKKVINAVAFSPDGKYLASASADKTIRLWDVTTGKHIRTLSGHQAAVSSISFSADGRWLASGSWDKTVRIWNVATGRGVQTLHPEARAIYSVTFDPHDHWLAAGSEDGAVEIWQWNGADASNQSSATP